MTKFNPRPLEPVISRTEIGYTIVKQWFRPNDDEDLVKVAGWAIETGAAIAPVPSYFLQDYFFDQTIFTFSGLREVTPYEVAIAFVDAFAAGNNTLIQAQYTGTEQVLDLVRTDVYTKNPVTLTGHTVSTESDVVGNPFGTVKFTMIGEANVLTIQARKVGTTDWITIYNSVPMPELSLQIAGGTYEFRYVSTIQFSDNTAENFPEKLYPGTIEVISGLSKPGEVTGITAAAYKSYGSISSYDLRLNWNYPTTDLANNQKRNFVITALPNPTFSTDYANLDWSGVSDFITSSNAYTFYSFPPKSPFVIRVVVAGWGTDSSEPVYIPIYITTDVQDSNILGYLLASTSAYVTSSRIQIDDEYIRGYSVFDANNPANNEIMFELSAITGQFILGRPGGAYNNETITTVPFLFDSASNRLQISGRTITDQIESASYVLTWIDESPPSLRTAGKPNYGGNAPGIWMGYTDLATFKFDLGDANKYIRWDGAELSISGQVKIGDSGRTIGQAQKQIFIYKRATEDPATPTGGTYLAPVPAGWSSTVPSGTDPVYMCSRLFTSDGFPPQEATWSTPSLFSPGVAGGGTTTYTWIKYADDAVGTGLSDDPTGKSYLGLAHNKTTSTESTNPADYQWAKITGEQGVPGVGVDGQTFYTWIKYSPNPDGTGMTELPDQNTMYIGIASNRETKVESNVPTDYVWSRFKGDTGVAGIHNYKSTVFIRQTTQPATPTGGSYASPLPASGSWSDSIPAGSLTLWASTRIFASDNASPPHQAVWSTPVAMTNTADLEIKYSSALTAPGNPSTSPSNWVDVGDETSIWMAQRKISNGVAQSWIVTKIKGEKGEDGIGEDGRVLSLNSSAQTVTYSADNVLTPAGQTINFFVSRQNIIGSTVWSAINSSGLDISNLLTSKTDIGATLNLSAFSGSVTSVRVTASADGLSDTISIAKVRDGAKGKDALVGFLTNETHTLSEDASGTIISYSGAVGNFKVFEGITDVTSSCTFGVVSQDNVTGTISSSGAYSVTNLTSAQGTLVLRAFYQSSTIDKVFTVSRAKAGSIGARGAGQYSVAFTGPTSSITNAMALAAKNATPNDTPVVGDIVTLYDNTPGVVPVSIIYQGPGDGSLASDWNTFTVTINGNLLVNGTVGADKININDLYSKNASISGQLQVGAGSTYTLIDGTNGGLTSFYNGTAIFSATPSGGYLNGRYLGTGTVLLDSLSASLKSWITEQTNPGGEFTYGGSAEYQGATISTGTFTLTPNIDCANGTVDVTFTYGGRSEIVTSQVGPPLPTISIMFKRNGANMFVNPLLYTGTRENFGDGVWFVTMPDISFAQTFNVTTGVTQFSVEVTVNAPAQWDPSSLGSFYAGVFQQPSGGTGGGGGATTLAALTDTTITSPSNGQVLAYNTSLAKWVNTTISTGGSTTLAGLTDTTITSPSNGQVLTYNTSLSKWVNYSIPAGVTNLAGLTDVAISSPTNGQAMVYNSSTSKWVNGTISSVATATSATKLSNGTGVETYNTANGLVIAGAPASHSYLYFHGGTYGTIYGTSSAVTIQGPNQTSNVASFGNSAISLFKNTSVSGTITATDCIATSDIRVKENLKRIDKPIERLKLLEGGFTFDRIDMGGIRHAGVIANRVQQALPEAIFESDTGLLTVSHSGMLGLLVEVCLNQQKQIDELKEKLDGRV